MGIDSLEISRIREDFPVFRHRAYLDTACYAPGCLRVARAVADWWTSACLISTQSFEQTFAWLQPVARARAEAAKLLNASEEEVAFITSTALGMSKIANSLPIVQGDNIVLNDLEFASNTVPWLHLRRRGLEIRRVKHVNGKLSLEDFKRLIDRRTKAVVVSTVQWTTGFRVDLKRLVEVAEENGAIVVVDGMQSVGALRLDVRDTGIHYMATQAHKWLFGGFGVGLVFCRADLLKKLDPINVETGNLLKDPNKVPYLQCTHLDNIADYDLGFVPTAAKFQTCPNIPGLWGFNEALKYINEIGIIRIENRVQHLVEYALRQLRTVAGIRIVSPLEVDQRSGIVVASTGSKDGDIALCSSLSQLGVGVSVRYQAGCGGIRVSCHFYNSEEDIDRLVSALKGETKPLYFH
ncbi:MAG: aminotransferase class V-fold PLP-dependent enzyme [Firmicutes bacterium]|nr:aminotransferase class V-fold PLP-dependent enzyme [Bacillota bacterium]